MSYVDRLVQERCNSIATALELHFSCTSPHKLSVWWRIIMTEMRNMEKIFIIWILEKKVFVKPDPGFEKRLFSLLNLPPEMYMYIKKSFHILKPGLNVLQWCESPVWFQCSMIMEQMMNKFHPHYNGRIFCCSHHPCFTHLWLLGYLHRTFIDKSM